MLAAEDVHNFTEALVAEEFDAAQIAQRYDFDYVQDLYCLTLNALPAHYVRHGIDVRINMDAERRHSLGQQIQEAMRSAHAVLAANRRQNIREG